MHDCYCKMHTVARIRKNYKQLFILIQAMLQRVDINQLIQ